MENRFGDHAPNDIENPSSSSYEELLRELESLSDHPLSSKCSIYRVPERSRVVNEKDFTPQLVSIGPLHHGKESLKPMEEYKKRYLCDYLKRTNVGLKYYINIVKEKEAELRSCYAEPIAFPTDEFVKMVRVDAAFIIEVLLRYYIPELQDEHDRIFKKPRMRCDIVHDMQLLENQLPFFILEDLFNPERISVRHDGEKLSIIKLSQLFFKELIRFAGTEDNVKVMSSSRVEHFVDFLRNFYVPMTPKTGEKKLNTFKIPTITELYRAGFKFQVRSSKKLLDIHFSKGILEIPKLTITDGSVLIIRNLLAFEQCHYTESYISSYVVIMDRLINTHKDVDLLVKDGIIDNQLGDSTQVATQINKLCNGVNLSPSDFYFDGIIDEIHEYDTSPWHKWKANLKQKYFNTPWAILSVIAAVLLLILTIIQAVCSIISELNK